MTGTSCDGLDCACIEIDLKGWRPLWSGSANYPARLRKQVLSAQVPGIRHELRALMKLDRDLGDWYGLVLQSLIKKSRPSPQIISNHGQTLAHYPNDHVTLQLGNPTWIAAKTGLTVISHFRDGDLAVSGQGAPLLPRFHHLLAHQLTEGSIRKGVAIHNVGGISNFTYIGPNSRRDLIIACDTGPGNIWIDAAAEKATRGKLKMDLGGKLAAQGAVDWNAVKKILRHPYFSKSPPKSTGRDGFPFSLLTSKTAAQGASLVATATAITIESCAQAYERFIFGKGHPLHRIFLCGGGAKNPALIASLQARLPSISVGTMEAVGWDNQVIEAQAFGYFGFLSLLGTPVGGSWTGARDFAPPGLITPGRNWRDILNKLNLQEI